MLETYENFVAIFSKEGTDVDATKQFFIKNGATDVQVSYDYITVDDDPNKAVSFFVKGMTWTQSFHTRLEMGLNHTVFLPESHYVCVDLGF